MNKGLKKKQEKAMTKFRITAIVVLVALFGGAVHLSSSFKVSAQKASKIQWEYSAIVAVYTFSPSNNRVNRVPGMVEICYFKPKGCERSEFKFDLDYGEFLQERGLSENYETRRQASLKACETAFQKAMGQLGDDGWEMIGEPVIDFEFVDLEEFNKVSNKSFLFSRNSAKAVYFKRIKTQ